MKKSFMTRVLATGLSLAMAFSLTAATNVTTAEAATSLMRATTKTLTEGQTRMTLMKKSYESKYRIKNTTRDADAKKIINVAKVRANKKGIDITAKKTAVTDAGLEQAKGVVTVNFVKKADANKKNAKVVKKAKVTVVVKAKAKPEEEKPAEVLGLKGVTQKKTTNFELTFAKELDKVAVADFKLVRDDDKADIQIKAVAIDPTDKTKVSLDTYLSLADGKSYTLTYTDADKKETTATFNVTDGKLAAFGLTPLKVTAGVATELKYQKLDANGMVLGEVKVGSPEANVTVEYKFTNTATSYADGDKIYLPNVGDKATVTVTKHTYQWNADGSEKDVIKAEIEVEAVASATTVDNYTFTISKREPAWEKLTSANNKIALEDSNYKAFFKILDSNNANVSDKYTVESADPSIIIANGNAGDGATLTPVKVGSTVLIVKDANGNSVKTENVQVVAKRVLSSVAVNRSAVKFASSATAPLTLAEVVYVSGKDQYGDDIAIKTIDVIENFKIANGISTGYDTDNTYVTFTSDASPIVGSYSYTVKANDKISVPVNVTVVNSTAVGAKAGYGFDFTVTTDDGTNAQNQNVSKVDLTTSADTINSTTITATLVQRKNAVSVKNVGDDDDANAVTVSAIKVYRVGGDVYANSSASIRPVSSKAINNQALVGTGSSVNAVNSITIKATDTTLSGAYQKYLVPGTYKVVATIKAKDGLTYTTEDSFEVVDRQTAITASVIKTTVDTTTDLTDAMDSENFVKLYDAAGKISSDHYTVTDVDAKFNGKTAYVKTITIELAGVDYGLGANKVIVEKIAINRTFTTANIGDWTK